MVQPEFSAAAGLTNGHPALGGCSPSGPQPLFYGYWPSAPIWAVRACMTCGGNVLPLSARLLSL